MSVQVLTNISGNKSRASMSPGKVTSANISTVKDSKRSRKSLLDSITAEDDSEVVDKPMIEKPAAGKDKRRLTADSLHIADFKAFLDASGSSDGSRPRTTGEDESEDMIQQSIAAMPSVSLPGIDLGMEDIIPATTATHSSSIPVVPYFEDEDLDLYAEAWQGTGGGRYSILPSKGRESIVDPDLMALFAEGMGAGASSGLGASSSRRASTMPSASNLPLGPDSSALHTGTSTKGPAHRMRTPGKSLMKPKGPTEAATASRRRIGVTFGSPDGATFDGDAAPSIGLTAMPKSEAKQQFGLHKSEPELGRLNFDDLAPADGRAVMDQENVAPRPEGGSARKRFPASPSKAPAPAPSPASSSAMDEDGDAIMSSTPAKSSCARRGRSEAVNGGFISPQAQPASAGKPPRAPATPKSANQEAAAAEAIPSVRRSPRLGSSMSGPMPSPVVGVNMSGDMDGDMDAPRGLMASTLGQEQLNVAVTAPSVDLEKALARVAAVTVAPLARSLSPGPAPTRTTHAPAATGVAAAGRNRRATFSVVPGRGLTVAGLTGGGVGVPAFVQAAPARVAEEREAEEDSGLDMDCTVSSADMHRLARALGDDSLSASMLEPQVAAGRKSKGGAKSKAAALSLQAAAAGDITLSLGLGPRGHVLSFPVPVPGASAGLGSGALAAGGFGISGLLGSGRLSRTDTSASTDTAPASLQSLLASERKANALTRDGEDVTTALPDSWSALLRSESGAISLDLSLGLGLGMGLGDHEGNERDDTYASMDVGTGDESVLAMGELNVSAHLAAEGVQPRIRASTPVGAGVGKKAGKTRPSPMTPAAAPAPVAAHAPTPSSIRSFATRATAGDDSLHMSGLSSSDSDSDGSVSSIDTAAVVEAEAAMLEKALPGHTPNRAAMLEATRSARISTCASIAPSPAPVHAPVAVAIAAARRGVMCDAETNTSVVLMPTASGPVAVPLSLALPSSPPASTPQARSSGKRRRESAGALAPVQVAQEHTPARGMRQDQEVETAATSSVKSSRRGAPTPAPTPVPVPSSSKSSKSHRLSGVSSARGSAAGAPQDLEAAAAAVHPVVAKAPTPAPSSACTPSTPAIVMECARAYVRRVVEGTGWTASPSPPSVRAQDDDAVAVVGVVVQSGHADGSAHALHIALRVALRAGGAVVEGAASEGGIYVVPSSSEADASLYAQGGLAPFHAHASAVITARMQSALTTGGPSLVPATFRDACAASAASWRAVDALCKEVAALRSTHTVRFTQDTQLEEGGAGCAWALALDVSKPRSAKGVALKARVVMPMDCPADATGGVYAYPYMPSFRFRVLWVLGPSAYGTALGAACKAAKADFLEGEGAVAGLVSAVTSAASAALRRMVDVSSSSSS